MTKLQTLTLLKALSESEEFNKEWTIYYRKMKSTDLLGTFELWFANKSDDSCLAHFFLKEESVNSVSHRFNFEKPAMEVPHETIVNSWERKAPFLIDIPALPNSMDFSKAKLTVADVIDKLTMYRVAYNQELETVQKSQKILNNSISLVNDLKLKGHSITKSGNSYVGKLTSGDRSLEFTLDQDSGKISATMLLQDGAALELINKLAA